MAKLLIRIIKFTLFFLLLWFLNSGFVLDPIWLPIQAGFFAVISLFIFKYQKLKLITWFKIIGLFYVASYIFEIFEISYLSVVAASTGFGILVILILFQVYENARL